MFLRTTSAYARKRRTNNANTAVQNRGRRAYCCSCLFAYSAQVQGDLRWNIQAGSAVEPSVAGNSRCYGSWLLPLAALLHGPEHCWRHGQQPRQPVWQQPLGMQVGPHNVPQMPNIALEKACNSGMTFKVIVNTHKIWWSSAKWFRVKRARQTYKQAIWARCVTFAGLPFGH